MILEAIESETAGCSSGFGIRADRFGCGVQRYMHAVRRGSAADLRMITAFPPESSQDIQRCIKLKSHSRFFDAP
jgi:hypothetical protein